jgi:hypothetical protein
VFDFQRGKGLGQGVGYHIFSGAINDAEFSFFYDLTNKMETDVDVFGASLVLVFLCQCDGRLVV